MGTLFERIFIDQLKIYFAQILCLGLFIVLKNAMEFLPILIVLLSFCQTILCWPSESIEDEKINELERKIQIQSTQIADLYQARAEDTEKLNDVLSKLVVMEKVVFKKCPVGKENVYAIGDGCYAFDKTLRRTFAETQQFCRTVFGPHLKGKIHEPRSKTQEKEVGLKWKEFANTLGHWLGIKDDQVEGVWKYVSDNQAINFNSWFGSNPSGGTSQNCAYQWYSDHARWFDHPCDNTKYPRGVGILCELI